MVDEVEEEVVWVWVLVRCWVVRVPWLVVVVIERGIETEESPKKEGEREEEGEGQVRNF